MPNFTPEDLILYNAYELDSELSQAITEELSTNWALREKFNVLKEAFARIDAMKLQSPRKQTINNILRYAMHKPLSV